MVHNPYPTKRRRRKDLGPRVKIGEQFIAHPVAMLKSAAFRSLKLAERKILDRLEIEHARHGGKRNGDLVCTYTDFRKHGVRKASISDAIKQLVRRGLIEITKQGRPSYGDLRNPSHYRLTYLSTFQKEVWTDATHEWRCLEKQKARYENVPGARHENVPGKANFPGTKTGLKPKKPGTKMGLLSRSTGRRGGEGACGMVNLSIPQNSPLLPSPLGINGIKKKKKLKHRSSDIVGRASSSLALQKASKRNSIFMHRILILLLP
jgi:hypothetical protein